MQIEARTVKPRKPAKRRPMPRPVRPRIMVTYHLGEANRCPHCGGRQWWIGRSMAECCYCHAALPIVNEGEADQALAMGKPS